MWLKGAHFGDDEMEMGGLEYVLKRTPVELSLDLSLIFRSVVPRSYFYLFITKLCYRSVLKGVSLVTQFPSPCHFTKLVNWSFRNELI